MRWIGIAAALACILLAAEARADTIYLKNGQSVWGTEAYEQGDTVVLERPGTTLRFPKAQVDRIEKAHISIPKYYSPPGTESAASPAAQAEKESRMRPVPPTAPGGAAEESKQEGGESPKASGTPPATSSSSGGSISAPYAAPR